MSDQTTISPETPEEIELIELLREHGEPAFILAVELMKQEAHRLGLAQSDYQRGN